MSPQNYLSLVLFLGFSLPCAGLAQRTLSSGGEVRESFDDYAGTGLVPSPLEGELDSNEWAVAGFSDGDTTFGGSSTLPDHGRGLAIGAVTAGGLYAFDVSNGVGPANPALGWQSSLGNFTPGRMRFRLRNGTGRPLAALSLSFAGFIFNDRNRASGCMVSVVRDEDAAEVASPDFDWSTPAAADAGPQWVRLDFSADIDLRTAPIANAATFTVEWVCNDLTPPEVPVDQRDQMAIDDIRIGTAAVCGDGVREGAEVCDDGNDVTETECEYGTDSCTGCRADCGATLALTGAVCGDGTVDTDDGEICDDRNTLTETACDYGTASCSACRADCRQRLSLTGPVCGDGSVDGAFAEVCDDGNTETESACPYGTASCTACRADCGAALSLVGATCGDGSLDTEHGEVCDDGNTATETSCAYGLGTCTACRADCARELSLMGPFCGDEVLDSVFGENCDDGNAVSETECPYGTSVCMTCSSDCEEALSLTGRVCGDGRIDREDGESCDDNNRVSGDGCDESCREENPRDSGFDADASVHRDGGVGGDGGGLSQGDAGFAGDASLPSRDAGVAFGGREDGCGCTVFAAPQTSLPWWAVAALVLGLVGRRRRRGPKSRSRV